MDKSILYFLILYVSFLLKKVGGNTINDKQSRVAKFEHCLPRSIILT
jgi:hypothetical protein